MQKRLTTSLSKKQQLLKMAKDKGITPESQRAALAEIQKLFTEHPDAFRSLEETRKIAWR